MPRACSDSAERGTCAAPGLIDPVLAAGTKSGYTVTYANDGVAVGTGAVPSGCAAWGSTGFNFANNPLSVTTGTNHYCIDETGVIRQGAAALAHAAPLRVGLRWSSEHAAYVTMNAGLCQRTHPWTSDGQKTD